MSTPWEPGCTNRELNGSRGPRSGGGMAFKCEAIRSKERGDPQCDMANWLASVNTCAGVDCPCLSLILDSISVEEQSVSWACSFVLGADEELARA